MPLEQMLMGQVNIHMRKKASGPLSHTKHKIYLRMTELNVRAETPKGTRVSLCDLWLGNGFLDTTSKTAQTIQR